MTPGDHVVFNLPVPLCYNGDGRDRIGKVVMRTRLDTKEEELWVDYNILHDERLIEMCIRINMVRKYFPATDKEVFAARLKGWL